MNGSDQQMIYIITVTYNPQRDGYLDQFLGCLCSQDMRFKTIIVDNDSRDGTAEKLRDIDNPDVEVLFNPKNVGFAAACNQAAVIAMANGATHIVFLNNDTRFESDFIRRLSTSMAESGADALSPLITCYPDTDAIWYAGGRFRLLSGYIPLHQNYGRSVKSVAPYSRFVDFASGCCLMVRREVFEKVGGFDENYFVYWEDADFCQRMTIEGYRIYFAANPSLFHIGSASTGGSASEFSIYQYNKNHMIFLRKHFGNFFAALSLFHVLPKMLVKLMVRRFDITQCKTQIDGLRDGWTLGQSKLRRNTPKLR
jgi:GT2 family glycosyltransferase